MPHPLSVHSHLVLLVFCREEETQAIANRKCHCRGLCLLGKYHLLGIGVEMQLLEWLVMMTVVVFKSEGKQLQTQLFHPVKPGKMMLCYRGTHLPKLINEWTNGMDEWMYEWLNKVIDQLNESLTIESQTDKLTVQLNDWVDKQAAWPIEWMTQQTNEWMHAWMN